MMAKKLLDNLQLAAALQHQLLLIERLCLRENFSSKDTNLIAQRLIE